MCDISEIDLIEGRLSPRAGGSHSPSVVEAVLGVDGQTSQLYGDIAGNLKGNEPALRYQVCIVECYSVGHSTLKHHVAGRNNRYSSHVDGSNSCGDAWGSSYLSYACLI